MRKLLSILLLLPCIASAQPRTITSFNNNWKFMLGDDGTANSPNYNDTKWRTLNLPHDWSIEGSFNDKHPTTFNQAALPAGVGWYRKSFILPASSKYKNVYINFDGVYRNSEVWINGHYLGKRPNGYISFRYDLTPYLNFNKKNTIAVKVDNSLQPNSRWYTGSGIYRKVWLLITNKVAVKQWGSFVTTPVVNTGQATVNIVTNVSGVKSSSPLTAITKIFKENGAMVAQHKPVLLSMNSTTVKLEQKLLVTKPSLWSVEHPTLYKVVTQLFSDGKIVDSYETTFGIRSFYFDAAMGFVLNNKPLKILGVCNHHDLGALGAAVNTRAIQRQLEILKAMGCNAIRTAHNPPAEELLDLCDKMGFIVMDEAFDMWAKRKNKQDYHIDFKQWHQQDLQDQILRDRNHPSIFIWSIGNEIREQFDSTGITITKDLVSIIKNLDTTRPITCALTENVPEKNFIYQSHALDLLGFNYKIDAYADLPKKFPGQKLIASETMSALATRGQYDMPSDSNRVWPPDSKVPFLKGNADYTVSAYDNAFAYWGTSHEVGWNAVKKHDFMSGLYVWAGFDFLGEPVPYQWPARSSYYGIIDLAGFPKDVYYMYQSEWTRKPVLHLFPHWNWQPGKVVDVWAYYNNADEAELFLNGRSLGVKSKPGDTIHVMWRVAFEPGTLKVVSRKNGKVVLVKEVVTAGKPAAIQLNADRKTIKSNGEDLSFITVKVVDKHGVVVPDADHLINFSVKGEGLIAGVDNGLQTSTEPFKASYRKAFNGLCIVIVQSKNKHGKIVLRASSAGLQAAEITLVAN